VLKSAEGHVGFVCKRCYGIWLPTKYLESLNYNQAFNLSNFKSILSSNKTIKIENKACPSCGTSMTTSIADDIEIDWCDKCGGVWFDKFELASLYSSIQEKKLLTSTSNELLMVRKMAEKLSYGNSAQSCPSKLTTQFECIGGYTPNHIPEKKRKLNSIFSVFLFLYGSYGVYVNNLVIPIGRKRGIHLHDVPAWIMYGAIICACLVMLSVIVDHYDKRNNETNYNLFANIFVYLGWAFFVLSLVMAAIR
jgi:Zn-finger nucleic acid-binding protein